MRRLHAAPLLLVMLARGIDAAVAGWEAYPGKGYTCSGAEYRGTVLNENGTAAGCSAAAQALNTRGGCHGGVNYATWPSSNPTACYVCRVPGAAAKLEKKPGMTSFVGPLPPAPPPCPPPPPPAPIPHYVCKGQQCVAGTGHLSYTDPKCFGQCSDPPLGV